MSKEKGGILPQDKEMKGVSPNIPVSQTQFGVTRPPGIWDIQNWNTDLSKLKIHFKQSLA